MAVAVAAAGGNALRVGASVSGSDGISAGIGGRRVAIGLGMGVSVHSEGRVGVSPITNSKKGLQCCQGTVIVFTTAEWHWLGSCSRPE